MRRTAFLAALAWGLSGTGCVHTSVTRTTAIAVPARSADCRLYVVFQGPPSRPYLVLGQVTTDSERPAMFAFGAANDIATMRRLEEQACAAGAHGLMSVIMRSELRWAGRGRWMSNMGGALAFVYVDAAGRPLAVP
jgi:hypothetical protein